MNSFKASAVVLLIFVVRISALQAQWQKTIHQAFPLPDSIGQLEIDLPWSYTTSSWINNGVLIETNILLENASETVLQMALKQGRYNMLGDTAAGVYRIRPALEEFPPMLSGKGAVREVITVKIFLPAGFIPDKAHVWVKKREDQP
jgi:hypothetical protein